MDWILLGQRVRKLRLQRQLTQEQLANSADTSNIYICRIENGTARPTITLLKKISDALQCPLSYMLDGKEIIEYDTNAAEICRLLDGCSPYVVRLVRNFVETISSG